MTIPVYTFAAYSNVGKTTYIEKLIPFLKEAGLRVAVMKHDSHDLRLDMEGKVSFRFSSAGADAVAVVSTNRFVLFEQRPVSLEEAVSHIRNVDVILTEGFKNGPYPKIALYRAASGKEMATAPEECFAIVSDTPMKASCPVFPLDDPQPLAQYLVQAVRSGMEQGE